MRVLENMNATIDYIEEHLLDTLHVPKIAAAIGILESDLQKTFYALTGISIVEYIRRRRLSLAVYDLQKGEQSVLEVALKYGYTSPDSFTRAFRQMHGITPSAVKRGGCLLKSYGKITFVLTIKGVNAMNYKIVKKGEIRIIGFKKWFSTENDSQLTEIPKMWDSVTEELSQQITALSNNDGVVGLCADMYDGGFDYWIGCMSDKECPENLEEMTIPASSWAVFEVIGSMRPLPNPMQDIWKRIYSEWLPNSGYKHAMIPEIEFYSAGDMMADDYRSEIWIPIKE